MITPMVDSPPHIFTIIPDVPFLVELAAKLLTPATRPEIFGNSSLPDYTILLPTRRSARSLAEIFIAQQVQTQKCTALLLPNIKAIDDIVNDDFAIVQLAQAHQQNFLPPAPKRERYFWLMQCLAKWKPELSIVDQSAWVIQLENLLDEAYNQDIDWEQLKMTVPDNLADNWQDTTDFLRIITRLWPEYLVETGKSDPIDHRNNLLRAQAAIWDAQPPQHPVIAAGSTGTIAATAELLKVIAHLPQGAVILPALDLDATDTEWRYIEQDPVHPQYTMAQLLKYFDTSRCVVQNWGASGGARTQMINRALAPSEIAAQQNDNDIDMKAAVKGLHMIETPDLRHEAGVIATLMRETLETEGARAALITPYRPLARRVAAELQRWGILVDDSAGNPLADMPPAEFVQLILRAHISAFATIDLLALLKHPLSRLGQERLAHLEATRDLECITLRGPSISGGIGVIRRHLDHAKKSRQSSDAKSYSAASALLDRIDVACAPMHTCATGTHSLAEHIDALIASATFFSAVSATDNATDNGAVDTPTFALHFDGRALMAFFDDLRTNAPSAMPLSRTDFAALLAGWLRAHRLRLPKARVHPRLFIWGLGEARLLQPDCVILGGLNESIWPQASETGPWLSRPMRATLGLSSLEQTLGLQARDFATLACAPKVILTRAQKVDGAPMLPSRWIRRLQAFVPSFRMAPESEKSDLVPILPSVSEMPQERLGWWRELDSMVAEPAFRPRPCPPLEARPNKLSATAIEKLIADPYEIYAHYILKLKELAPVAADVDHADFGNFIHAIFEAFGHAYPEALPDDITTRFMMLADEQAMKQAGGDEILKMRRVRIEAIADWFADYEPAYRTRCNATWVEQHGTYTFDISGTPFTITARADRIDRHNDGVFEIGDYKTGSIPSQTNVENFWSPQLFILAMILEAGGFKKIPPASVSVVNYIRVTGDNAAAQIVSIPLVARATGHATRTHLTRLIGIYRNPKTHYTAVLRAERLAYLNGYQHLARFAEWKSSATASDAIS